MYGVACAAVSGVVIAWPPKLSHQRCECFAFRAAWVIRPAHREASRQHWTSMTFRLTLVLVHEFSSTGLLIGTGFRAAALNTKCALLGFVSLGRIRREGHSGHEYSDRSGDSSETRQ